jgi:hypothetical protein
MIGTWVNRRASCAGVGWGVGSAAAAGGCQPALVAALWASGSGGYCVAGLPRARAAFVVRVECRDQGCGAFLVVASMLKAVWLHVHCHWLPRGPQPVQELLRPVARSLLRPPAAATPGSTPGSPARRSQRPATQPPSRLPLFSSSSCARHRPALISPAADRRAASSPDSADRPALIDWEGRARSERWEHPQASSASRAPASQRAAGAGAGRASQRRAAAGSPHSRRARWPTRRAPRWTSASRTASCGSSRCAAARRA